MDDLVARKPILLALNIYHRSCVGCKYFDNCGDTQDERCQRDEDEVDNLIQRAKQEIAHKLKYFDEYRAKVAQLLKSHFTEEEIDKMLTEDLVKGFLLNGYKPESLYAELMLGRNWNEHDNLHKA